MTSRRLHRPQSGSACCPLTRGALLTAFHPPAPPTMRTTARLALALLLAAAPAAGTAQRGDADERIVVIYHPEQRLSRVTATVRKQWRTPAFPVMELALRTSHPDTIPSRPIEQFQLTLSAGVGDAPPRFAGVGEATFLLDDSVEIRLVEGKHSIPFFETLTFPVSLEQATKLGTARSVQGRIGPWEFRLTPGEIARISRLLAYARLRPVAPVPLRATQVSPGVLRRTGPSAP